MTPDTVVKIDGREYMLVPVDDFNGIMRQVVIMAQLATVLAERHAAIGTIVTPEFRAAFADGMQKLAARSPEGRHP